MPRVIFEDNHILVVIKPQNIPVCEDESKDGDLLNELKGFLKEKYKKPGNVYLGLVHRLDRPTGGIMVFAKTSKAAARLSEQMRNDDFEKNYFTIVSGVPKMPYGRLTNYLKKDEKENKVELATQLEEDSKLAELDYKIIESKEGMSLVKVKLLTGRSHQIRVQFSSIGCPVCGDNKYGKETSKSTTKLALWASGLKFNHPVTKQRLAFNVLPPEDEAPWSKFDLSRVLKI